MIIATTDLTVSIPGNAGGIGLLEEKLLAPEVIHHQDIALIHYSKLVSAGGEKEAGRKEGREGERDGGLLIPSYTVTSFNVAEAGTSVLHVCTCTLH